MPVQSVRRAGGVAGQRRCAHEHGRHGLLVAARGCATVCARAEWHGFVGRARAAAGAHKKVSNFGKWDFFNMGPAQQLQGTSSHTCSRVSVAYSLALREYIYI